MSARRLLAPGTPAHRQKDETCLWIRERFLQARPGDFEAHVVHGHTPIWEGKPDPAEPELLEHRTSTSTPARSRLACSPWGCFDAAAPGGPVEVLMVKGARSTRFVPDPPEPAASARRGGSGRRRRGIAFAVRAPGQR